MIFDLEAVGSDSRIFSKASATSSGKLTEKRFIFSPLVIKFIHLLTFLTKYSVLTVLNVPALLFFNSIYWGL